MSIFRSVLTLLLAIMLTGCLYAGECLTHVKVRGNVSWSENGVEKGEMEQYWGKILQQRNSTRREGTGRIPSLSPRHTGRARDTGSGQT